MDRGGGDVVRLAHITDAHVTLEGSRTATLKDLSVPVFTDLVSQARERGVDLSLFGGDNIDNHRPELDDLGVFLQIAKNGTPFAAVLGNHEARLRRGCLSKHRITEALALTGSPHPDYCFSRAVKNVRVIGIDSTLVGSVGGYFSDSVMRFLARELRAAEEDHIVVLGHHLIERAWAPHWLDSWDREYLVSNREEVISLLATNPRVRAYLCGHHHASRICRVASRGRSGGFYQIVTSSPVAFPHTARLIEVCADGLRIAPLVPRVARLHAEGKKAVLTGRKAQRYRVFGDEEAFLGYLAGNERDNDVFLPHHHRLPPKRALQAAAPQVSAS